MAEFTDRYLFSSDGSYATREGRLLVAEEVSNTTKDYGAGFDYHRGLANGTCYVRHSRIRQQGAFWDTVMGRRRSSGSHNLVGLLR